MSGRVLRLPIESDVVERDASQRLRALLMLAVTVSTAMAQVELGCQAGRNPDHPVRSLNSSDPCVPLRSRDYDKVVLSDRPMAYWRMSAEGGAEPDLTGNGNTGTYVNALPAAARMPNGDPQVISMDRTNI